MAIDPEWLARIERLYPGPRLPGAQDAAARARHVVDPVRPRLGAHRRPDQPLQHDVRPVLHGRQPGRLRPRAAVGGHHQDPRRRDVDPAAPPDERAVLRRRADAVAATSSTPSATRASAASSPCSARPTGCASPQEPGFAKAAKEAGLRMAYLQFDGVGNEANSHRKIGNLFDVKLRAIEELAAAGIDVILVVTVVNGVNNDQIGKILQFAVDNPDKITVVSFQPVSFTGRDEDIDDETRAKAALHAVAPRLRRQSADRRHRADARLVPAVGAGAVLGSRRPPDGRARRLGRDEVRLPPQLRHRHRAHGQQEDAADGAAHAVPRHGGAARRHRHHHRRRAGQAAHGRAAGAGAGQELSAGAGAARLQLRRADEAAPVADRRARPEDRRVRDATPTSSSGACCSSPACGSRICSTTTSAAPRCASSRTARRWARSASAPTTPASAGATSSRRCCRTRPSPSGTRRYGRHAVYAKGQDFPMPAFEQPISSRVDGEPIRLRVLG